MDFSAGWGDRLIGAIAAPTVVTYLGVDPNVDLREGHLKAVRSLLPIKMRDTTAAEKYPPSVNDEGDNFPEQFRIIYEPFESAQLPAKTFHQILTQPNT